MPPTVAEYVCRRTGLRLDNGKLGIRSGPFLGFMGLRAQYSPGHPAFRLHLGDREGQEVPGSQSNVD